MTENNPVTSTQEILLANFAAIRSSLSQGTTYADTELATPPGLGDISEAESYEIQAKNNVALAQKHQLEFGGYKVSMTSPEDRALVNAPEPSYGTLFEDQFLTSPTQFQLEQLNNILLEPEIIFRATEKINNLSPQDSDLLESFEVTGGIEIPMSRVPDWFPPGQLFNIDLRTFVIDNAGAGFVVCSDDWQDATAIDLPEVAVQLHSPDGTTYLGRAQRVMESPVNSLKWLLERLLTAGTPLEAGTMISSGTLMSPIRPEAGEYTADFSHGLGSVLVRFR